MSKVTHALQCEAVSKVTYAPQCEAVSKVTRALQCEAVSKAVSYTHLRAHETRHDLVCRLLLEKKFF